MVVLTTCSSQFSPRTLKNFVRDKMTWRVLSVFTDGFIYNTLSLLLINEVQPGQMVVASTARIFVALICLIFFAFLYHVATEIQVSTLIEELVDDAERVIADYTNLQENRETTAKQIPKKADEWLFTTNLHGSIQLIKFEKPISFTQEKKETVKLMVHVSDFIHHKQTVMKLYADEKPNIEVGEYIL